MKLIFTLFLGLFWAHPSLASVDQPGGLQVNPEKIVENLAEQQLGNDFNTTITFSKNSNLCGMEGNVYVVEVQVKKWMKTFCENDGVCLVPRWEVVKTYGILESEVSEDASLMDFDTCLE